MKWLRAAVTGGRDYNDYATVSKTLNTVEEQYRMKLFILEGGSTGADTLARDWAEEKGRPRAKIPAPWEMYGKEAGPMRNGWILDLEPDLLIPFPGNQGTNNMITQAKLRDIPIWSKKGMIPLKAKRA